MVVTEENSELDTTCFESYLHSRITVGFFLVMLVVLLKSGYDNNSIVCTSAKSIDVPPAYVETKCWINGLKMVTTDHLHETNVTAPKSLNSSEPDVEYVLELHKWFKFYLGIQCLLLLLPRWFLSHLTDNDSTLRHLVGQCTPTEAHNQTSTEFKERLEYSVNYGVKIFMLGFNRRNFYYWAKILVVVLYITNTYLQFNFLHGLAGSETSVLDFHWWEKIVHSFSGTIVLPNIFPRITKCTLSGYQKLMVNLTTAKNVDQGDHDQYKTLIEEEFQCFLPQSSINEKIFLIVWAWLLMLLVVSLICFVWKIFTMIPLQQTRMLCWSWMCPAVRLVNPSVRQLLSAEAGLQDMHLLVQLGHNLPSSVYAMFLERAYRTLSNEKRKVGKNI